MRVMALDSGDRRIGVALSDPTQTLSSPLSTIDRAHDKDPVKSIVSLADEHGTDKILVGLPITLAGELGTQARTVLEFVEQLKAETNIGISTVDERHSTTEARRRIRESSVTRSRRERGDVDAAAAAVMLQSYLDTGNL